MNNKFFDLLNFNGAKKEIECEKPLAVREILIELMRPLELREGPIRTVIN